MIGLVDLQLQQWDKPRLCPPNLEIMKLAQYYKAEENKFCRLINLDETELSSYDKIYIFSESKDFITVPDAFKRAPNVIYGGSAFTNGVYVPFENTIIDFTLPKTEIYKQLLKEKYVAGLQTIEIERLLDNCYYRWHAGDEVLPLTPVKNRKRVYIYDTDFFLPGWQKVIDKIFHYRPSSINLIHPAHYHKISDFLEVRENCLIARSNDAFLDLDIPLKETPVLMKHYKNRLLASIVPSAQVYISLGGSFHYRSDYLKNIIYKLNLLYIFWSNNIPLKIKYEEPTLGCYDPIADLSKLIATWTQGESKHNKSIIDRIPKDKGLTDIRPENEQLDLILKSYPSKDTLFRQTFTTVKQGGIWHYEY